MGSQRVGHDLETEHAGIHTRTLTRTHIHRLSWGSGRCSSSRPCSLQTARLCPQPRSVSTHYLLLLLLLAIHDPWRPQGSLMSVKMLGYLHGAKLIQLVPEKDSWTDSASPQAWMSGRRPSWCQKHRGYRQLQTVEHPWIPRCESQLFPPPGWVALTALSLSPHQ